MEIWSIFFREHVCNYDSEEKDDCWTIQHPLWQQLYCVAHILHYEKEKTNDNTRGDEIMQRAMQFIHSQVIDRLLSRMPLFFSQYLYTNMIWCWMIQHHSDSMFLLLGDKCKNPFDSDCHPMFLLTHAIEQGMDSMEIHPSWLANTFLQRNIRLLNSTRCIILTIANLTRETFWLNWTTF